MPAKKNKPYKREEVATLVDERKPAAVQANQYEPDPRQLEFLRAYLTFDSPTFSNAYKSALAAGYSENYATSITSTPTSWLRDIVRNSGVTEAQVLANLGAEATDKKLNKGFERIKALELIGKHVGMFKIEKENTVSGEIVIRLGSPKDKAIIEEAIITE